MDNPLNIKKASLKDLDNILLLLEDLDYYIENREQFQHVASLILEKDQMWAVFLAVQSGESVGFVSVHVKPALRIAGYMASIDELVVRKDLRGSGVGSALLDKALLFAREYDCKRVEVLSSKRRESYKREFYIKHGFTEHPSAVFRVNK